jgi:nucleotide-binding universal stress UspA family protein
MPGEVIVALDGSDKEPRALPVAVALADLAEGGIHLVRVIRAASERMAAQAALLAVDQAAMLGRPDAEQQVAETARRLTVAATKHAITWDVVEGEDVVHELIRQARERDARAVVMGTRAPTSVGLALAGSVADRVMRECPKPVVLVPPGAAHLRGKRMQIGRVLVPLDGSALAARSLDYMLSLPRATELEFVLIAVALAADTRANAEKRLQVFADRVRERGAAVEVRVIKSDDAAKTIAEGVRELTVEMIAMSTRGEGGFSRLVLGSVAQAVVRAAEVPVLLITPAMLSEGAA